MPLLLMFTPFFIALLMPNKRLLEIFLGLMFILLISLGVVAQIDLATNFSNPMSGFWMVLFYVGLCATGLGAIVKSIILKLSDHPIFIIAYCFSIYLITDNNLSWLKWLGLVQMPSFTGG